jgi:arsenate reductase
MAEGIAKRLLKDDVIIQSAGTEPKVIHPLAIQVMKEIDIDISHQQSKSLDAINSEIVEYVITLCAEEACPIYLRAIPQVHWPLPDPGAFKGTEEEKLGFFRKTREELLKRIKQFIKENTK